MTIVELRENLSNDIFGVMELNSCLGAYRNKAAKIASMLRRSEIIQIRRGLYTFAAPLRRGTLTSGVLANRIYGPSYVSEDFALSYYCMIPETPAVITSIAMGRSREFCNDFGRFSYWYCRSEAYSIGITFVGEEQSRYHIATPEKAIFDKVLYDKRFDGENPQSYLLDDLRMDEDALSGLDKKILTDLAPFMCGRLRKLYHYLKEL